MERQNPLWTVALSLWIIALALIIGARGSTEPEASSSSVQTGILDMAQDHPLGDNSAMQRRNALRL